METKKNYQQRKKIEKEQSLSELKNKLLIDDQVKQLDEIQRSDLEREIKNVERDLNIINRNICEDRDKDFDILGI
jgi:hypothetical protein